MFGTDLNDGNSCSGAPVKCILRRMSWLKRLRSTELSHYNPWGYP